MKNWFLCALLFFTNSLAASNTTILSDEFVAYHLNVAVKGVEDEAVFNLIQENINNLKYSSTTDSAANELIYLIEEGYKIDPFNMSKLIDLLIYSTPTNNATKVMIKAIEYDSSVTPDHLTSLIDKLLYATSTDNATVILIAAIEHGVKFGPKERCQLAEKSKYSTARKNVEKIRKALHEREINR